MTTPFDPHALRLPAAAALLVVAAAVAAGCKGNAGEPDERPSTATQTARLATAPMPRPPGALAAGQSCVSSGCHAAFADTGFGHGFLRSGEHCSICHQDDQGGHVFPLRDDGAEQCTSCHAGVTGQRIHQHAAAEVGCLACHLPHLSGRRSLLRADSVAAVCATCHPPASMSGTHAPYVGGECTACHDPHESDFASLLRGGEGVEHCYLCHDETRTAMTTASHVHAPAAQDCLVCHEPHASDYPHALRQPVDKTCFSCHADLEKMIAGVAAPHGALVLEDQCGNCHDAHASDYPNLLKDRQDRLCLHCHDKPIEAYDGRTIPDMTAGVSGRKFLHGPVESGNCTACHNVHGAGQSRLLRDRFTEAFYTSFDLKHYALCFECHEDALVTTARTDALTGFRDGDLNLHYLHVNRQEKGRTCRACHELHGSDEPFHMAKTVPFGTGDWALPIGFEQTDTGGSCAPGCHKPMSYDRVVPTWGANR